MSFDLMLNNMLKSTFIQVQLVPTNEQIETVQSNQLKEITKELLLLHLIKTKNITQLQLNLQNTVYDLNKIYANETYPIIYASQYGNAEIVRLLIVFGADISIKHNDITALINSIKFNNYDITNLLLDLGVPVNFNTNGLSREEIIIRLVKKYNDKKSCIIV